MSEDIPAQAAQLLGSLSLPLQAVPYLSPYTPRAELVKYSNPWITPFRLSRDTSLTGQCLCEITKHHMIALRWDCEPYGYYGSQPGSIILFSKLVRDKGYHSAIQCTRRVLSQEGNSQ